MAHASCGGRAKLAPNTAFQSDPRRPALQHVLGILARGDLSMPIAARAAKRHRSARLSPFFSVTTDASDWCRL